MGFRQEMDFEEADRRYAELERRREAGAIGDEEFDAQRQQLMVLDGEGRWWSKSPETGEWHYYDGNAWVPGMPAGPESATDFPPAPAPSSSIAGSGKRRSVWFWVLAAVGIVLIGLLGLGLIVRSFLPPSEESAGGSEAAREGSGGPSDAAAFDAVFVHRATAGNVSANSTFLDESSINDNPDAVLYVTQNWNPGGEGGTYSDHPVGVWYDGDRGRWAIFNQDREAMPEGAAFNVFVLESPPG